jgi:hypothetical protein
MSQLESANKSYIAGTDLAIFIRVVLQSDGTVIAAGNSEAGIGVTQGNALAGGEITVRLFNAEGTLQVTAAGAISNGAVAYAAADGKIASSGTIPVAIAQEATSANDDQIEVAAILTTGSLTAAFASIAATIPASTTVAVANTGTPDGVAHVTGQVKDANGNAKTGHFLVMVRLGSATYGAPVDLGTATAKTNSLIWQVQTTDSLLLVRTHSDGSWGVDLDLAADGTLYADAAVIGAFAEATAAITGN